jgi:hypothetical protein
MDITRTTIKADAIHVEMAAKYVHLKAFAGLVIRTSSLEREDVFHHAL